MHHINYQLTADGDRHRAGDRDEPRLSAEGAGAHLRRGGRVSCSGDVDTVEAHRAGAVSAVAAAHRLLENHESKDVMQVEGNVHALALNVKLVLTG